MQNIKSFPNNQDVYVGAEWVMKWLHGRTSGVFGAENNLATSVVPDSMSIEVSDGVGWISNANDDGIVFWNDEEKTSGKKLTLTHDVADGALDRIDRIVVTWETTNYVALPTISVLKGTASSNPVPPALTNNNIQRQISLRQQRIPAGSISLSATLGTDERLNPDVCGIVTESVKIDTSTMQSQFEALLDSISKQLDDLQQGTATALKQRGTAVLTASGWEDGYQTVIVGGVTENNDVFVSVPEAYYEAYSDAGIRCVEQSAGQLKFFSDSAPATDITVGILIIS
jgi:hypothetical protein